MKNLEIVKNLIEHLKVNAENEFELHRIKVLERDLIEGLPQPEIIDNYHQQFNGKIYRIAKSGHYYNGRALHQDVWEYYHGVIPRGDYNIHHRDWDASNNLIENLQLLTLEEHRRIHANTPPPEVSPDKVTEFVCERCGKTYRAAIREGHRFCSRACQRAAQLDASKKHNKVCLFCKKEFLGCKESKYCSQECRIAHQKARAPVRICPQCGKQFRDTQNSKKRSKIYCSKKCQYAAHQLSSEELRMSNHPNTRVVLCKNCGKEFLTIHPLKCYCSKQCSTEYTKKSIHIHKKICPICNKEFLGTKRQKHCSTKCRDQARRNSLKLTEKVCPICKTAFKTRDKRVKYCSRECYRISKNKVEHKPRVKKIELTCLQCGKSFKATDKKTKYCSSDCYHKATRTLPDKICPTCGKMFRPSGKARKFCSRECIRYEKKPRIEIVKRCPVCGEEFTTHDNRKIHCSRKCASIAHRNTLRQCPVCGKEFYNKPEEQIHCSRHCANIARKLPKQKCLVCGKEFQPRNSKAKYCSQKCARNIKK